MKKVILFFAVAAAALSSCSKENEFHFKNLPLQEEKVEFDSSYYYTEYERCSEWSIGQDL